MFIDDESTESETSIEVNQQVNEESLGNTIQGNLLFQNTYTPFLLQSTSTVTHAVYNIFQQNKFIIVIYVDDENTGLETSVVVEENFYVESAEYIIQGIIP